MKYTYKYENKKRKISGRKSYESKEQILEELKKKDECITYSIFENGKEIEWGVMQ